MAVIWKPRTGNYLEVLPNLTRALGQYTSLHDHIKVGLTVDPDARWNTHKNDGWTDLIVLYETSSPKYCAAIEAYLIEYGWQKHLDKSWNERSGGAGLKQGYLKYFVYVLVT